MIKRLLKNLHPLISVFILLIVTQSQPFFYLGTKKRKGPKPDGSTPLQERYYLKEMLDLLGSIQVAIQL